MSVELLQTLSFAAYIIAGIMAMIAVILFFALDIRKVFGDVSGTTAKRAIEDIRRQNELSGDKAYKPSYVNMSRGRVTDKISPSGRLSKMTAKISGSVGTEKISTAKLSPAAQTDIISSETTILTPETTVLYPQSEETTLLSMEMQNDAGEAFEVEVEMGFLGSTEIIE